MLPKRKYSRCGAPAFWIILVTVPADLCCRVVCCIGTSCCRFFVVYSCWQGRVESWNHTSTVDFDPEFCVTQTSSRSRFASPVSPFFFVQGYGTLASRCSKRMCLPGDLDTLLCVLHCFHGVVRFHMKVMQSSIPPHLKTGRSGNPAMCTCRLQPSCPPRIRFFLFLRLLFCVCQCAAGL